MSLIPVEGKDGFFRDSATNAIVNKNRLEYQSYVSNREKLSTEKQRINTLENDMDRLKGDLDEIKSLLKKIVEG